MTNRTTTNATAASRRLGHCAWPAIAVAWLVFGPGPAGAVDDVVAADPQAAEAGKNLAKLDAVVFAANVVNNPLTVVDQFLFPRDQGAALRSSWESPLARQLAELKRCCNLTDAQTKKMALAMQCDVTRFYDDVERLRERYSDPGRPIDLEMQREVFPMQLKIQTGGFCGPDSFFEKMLEHVLDGEQLLKYRAIVDERLRERYLTAVDIVLLDLEDRVPLDSRQHETIRRLLVAKQPPRVVPRDWPMMPLIMYRLSRIPQDQLQPLFDHRQWAAFNQDRLRYAGSRDLLRRFGVLREGE